MSARACSCWPYLADAVGVCADEARERGPALAVDACQDRVGGELGGRLIGLPLQTAKKRAGLTHGLERVARSLFSRLLVADGYHLGGQAPGKRADGVRFVSALITPGR